MYVPGNTFKKAYKSVYVHQINISENQREKVIVLC